MPSLSALLFLLLFALAPRVHAAQDDLRKSLVKLYVISQPRDIAQPWQLGQQRSSSASGCIVEGRRILTNAHVVADQVYIHAQREGDARKFSARVEFVGHDTELAVLTVDDPAFYEGSVPVRLGELPDQRDKLAIYGFSVGGDDLSITEGVVSRIEMVKYEHGQADLLAIQTDAAINLGNSGGPAFQDGKLVGVAFQFLNDENSENIGYVVPAPIVKRFFKDIADGRYDGLPELGGFWQELGNASMRQAYGLKPQDPGILINRTIVGGSFWGQVRPNDVLTHIDGVRIEGDGSVALNGSTRVKFVHLADMRQIGDSLALRVLRDGRPLSLSVTLRASDSLVPRPQYDKAPTYFVFAGLVFQPLTFNYLAQWDWKEVAPAFKYFYEELIPSRRRKQVVLLTQVLAHDVNAGYHDFSGFAVDKINGTPITEIADVPKAFDKPLGRHHVLEFENEITLGPAPEYESAFGTRVVLDAEAARRASAEILSRYGVPADRSADLRSPAVASRPGEDRGL